MNAYFVVLLAVIAVAYAKVDVEESQKHFNLCKAETRAEESYEDVIKKNHIPTSEKGKCLLECMLRLKGVYDTEGKYNQEATKKYFAKVFAHRPEIVDKSVAIADECDKTIDVTGLNRCDAAVKRYTCAHAKYAQEKINFHE